MRQLFRVVLLLQLASVAIAVWGIGTFDAWTATTGIADATQQYDTVKRASGRLGLAVELVAGLALAGWLYRAHRSDRVSSEWTEHWAGWTFLGWVPPFCVFMPYGIIRDLRQGAQGEPVTRWPALGWWMTTLVVGAFVSWLSAAMYAQADGPGVTVGQRADSYASGAWIDLVSGLLLTVSLLLLLRVLRTVTRVVTDSPFGVAAEAVTP
ncbi:hypothetical protein GCM10009795_060440 [Nocardioides hankookensis]